MESVLEEAEKGVAFHEQQLVMSTRFHSRASEYVEEVRREADALAIRGEQLVVDSDHAHVPGPSLAPPLPHPSVSAHYSTPCTDLAHGNHGVHRRRYTTCPDATSL